MAAADDRRADPANADRAPLAIVCGGGSLPYAVAAAAVARGRQVLLFALHGFANPQAVAQHPHHWIRLGQGGRLVRLARQAGCRDMVMIGSIVRPTLLQLWPDYGALQWMPRMAGLFRGGDDRLLSGVAALLTEQGFRLVGAHEIAPEITMPQGAIGRGVPGDRDRSDIARGLALLQATGPFDIGQAVVVADGRVLAIEAAGGTDEMLAHLADLRERGRVRSPAGTGVLVKAPKPGQDRRVDLPSIGPQTVEGAARAGLAGIAVVAGSAVVAEPERIATAADRAKLFVVGIGADGSIP
jgi:DUF1009 family protein